MSGPTVRGVPEPQFDRPLQRTEVRVGHPDWLWGFDSPSVRRESLVNDAGFLPAPVVRERSG
jgi:hypothetical protein